MSLDHDLSEDELQQLGEFLSAPALEETSMDVCTLEGFFAALAIGPRTVMPSEWIACMQAGWQESRRLVQQIATHDLLHMPPVRGKPRRRKYAMPIG